MSIRSKMKFGGGLPVGGRSSGGRPKKVKHTKKASPAAKAAASVAKGKKRLKKFRSKKAEIQSESIKEGYKRTKRNPADVRDQETWRTGVRIKQEMKKQVERVKRAKSTAKSRVGSGKKMRVRSNNSSSRNMFLEDVNLSKH